MNPLKFSYGNRREFEDASELTRPLEITPMQCLSSLIQLLRIFKR